MSSYCYASRVTTNTWKYLPFESMHSGHNLSWSVSRSVTTRRVANCFKGIRKCVVELSVRFQLELNKLGSLGTPTHKKNLKDLFRVNARAVFRKCFAEIQ